MLDFVVASGSECGFWQISTGHDFGMDKVACASCSSNVVPRLYFRGKRDDLLFKQQIDHICPNCGQTMYSTGGGVTVVARICIAAALIAFGKFQGWSEWVTLWIVPLAAIAIIIGPLRVIAGFVSLVSFFKASPNKNT